MKLRSVAARRRHTLKAIRHLMLIAVLILLAVGASGQPPAPPADGERARALEAVTRANIGLAYLEQGSFAKALDEFRSVAQIFPDEPLGHANLAVAQLRLNRFQEAEQAAIRALALDPSNPDLHVLLGETLQAQGRDEDAQRSFEKALPLAPAHLRARYKLAKLAEKHRVWNQGVEHLLAIVRTQPDNLPVLLDAARLLAQHLDPAAALPILTQVEALFEGVEADFIKHLKASQAAAKARARDTAMQIQIVANRVRASALYRQGIARLALQPAGVPLERFSERLLAVVPEVVPRAVPVTFSDVTAEVGIPTGSRDAVSGVFFDLDGDGRLDLFICSGKHAAMYRNEKTRFVDVTSRVGLAGSLGCASAVAGDVDNDGRVDLLVHRHGAPALYRNDPSGRFIDATGPSGIADRGMARAALWVDFDHDGDLDLLTITDAVANAAPGARLYRNQGTGRFEDVTRTAGIDLAGQAARAAAAGDFDDDGDLDVLVTTADSVHLYSNLRQGRFKNVARDAGLELPGDHTALVTGDFNNDGALDVFIGGAGERSNRLYRGLGNGRFKEAAAGLPLVPTAATSITDGRFADFDNDGSLDLLLVGTIASGNDGPRAARLYRNQPRLQFVEATGLPPLPGAARRVTVADYDEDGDLDILLVFQDGAVRLLRNDGGNANHWLKVRLKGLSTGNTKNNLYGLGAKLEIKAGSLYAMRVADQPVTHFGLGPIRQADLLRVIWPNGEPDIFFAPSSDQLIQAEQRLKGSCPFLFTWDGQRYAFVTDIHWRNLLGMVLPDGSWAPPDPARDYFKISGDKLRPRDGVYTLQITEELWETTFLDQVQLLVVDHPPPTEIHVNEAFIPPPFPGLELATITRRRPPLRATDDHGRDVLPLIRDRDGRYLANFGRTAYQGYTHEHSVILDFGDLSQAPRIRLFLYGWLNPFDSSVNVAVSQRRDLPFRFPRLEAIGRDGRWQTVVENVGAPAGKNKTVMVDLTGKFPTQDFRMRIATTMEIAWDEIFLSTDEDQPVRVTRLAPSRADLHYRGFSRPYRATTQGPVLFDYHQVTRAPLWRPMQGRHTRYGKVRPLLVAPDDMYVVMGSGDELTVEFDAAAPPPLAAGWVRDFIIYTEGWIKEGETNGALAQTVEPLVFHGMTRYPYGSDERYPDGERHQEFLRTYMTRVVTDDAYREVVRRYVPHDVPGTVTRP